MNNVPNYTHVSRKILFNISFAIVYNYANFATVGVCPPIYVFVGLSERERETPKLLP